ncbi:MAG: hypothetical protein IEMM0007_0153 [bacterium]|nr:MAG: hypothetical protein IEMM0007_0153 [bacterium]
MSSEGKPQRVKERAILLVEEQVRAWHIASRKMGWGIRKEEFHGIGIPPSLTDDDLAQGFSGVSLFYGFGDDGSGHADSVLSGKMAWDYACKRKKGKLWQGLAESLCWFCYGMESIKNEIISAAKRIFRSWFHR